MKSTITTCLQIVQILALCACGEAWGEGVIGSPSVMVGTAEPPLSVIRDRASCHVEPYRVAVGETINIYSDGLFEERESIVQLVEGATVRQIAFTTDTVGGAEVSAPTQIPANASASFWVSDRDGRFSHVMDCDYVVTAPTPECGNGVLETGEFCDPPGSCPQSCDDGNACMVAYMTGAPETCDVLCSYLSPLTCTNGDGCCTSGCTIAEDDDC